MNKWSVLLMAGFVALPLVARADGSSGKGECREMEIKAKVNKKNETIKGLACRDEKGKWHLQDSKTVATAPPPPAPVRSQEVTVIDEPVVVTRTIVSEPVTRYVFEEPPVRTYYYPEYYSRGVIVDVGWPRYYGHRHYRHW
ncbi:MAG: hypothetical protein HQL77_08225 [Magnetococcales bacterium]|nr:hypothetical protein [Magnetococcales bacterium]